MLKFFPGALEWVGTGVVPGLAVLALFLLPFFDRNPSATAQAPLRHYLYVGCRLKHRPLDCARCRHYPPRRRPAPWLARSASKFWLVGPVLRAVASSAMAQRRRRRDQGVEGLEGVVVKPINTRMRCTPAR